MIDYAVYDRMIRERVKMTTEIIATNPFAIAVRDELRRARGKHPKPIHSAHEGFAVLLEEVEEVKQEVFHGKDKAALRAELIQVAAMAQRMAEDIDLPLVSDQYI